MAERKIGVDLLFDNAQLLKPVIHNTNIEPVGSVAGQLYYHTSEERLHYHNGTQWIPIATSSAEDVQDIIGAMISGNVETGLTITYDDGAAKLDFIVGPLNQITSPVDSVDFNNHRLINLATPVDQFDGVNKAYLETRILNLNSDFSVAAAASSHVTINSPGLTIDGVGLLSGDKVLLVGQVDPIDNGIYTYVAVDEPLVPLGVTLPTGFFIIVRGGGENGGRLWVVRSGGIPGISPIGFSTANYLDRTFHTGTQLASTISDFDIQVRISALDQMATPTYGNINWNGFRIVNAQDPVDDQDYATKAYVDSGSLGFLTRYATNIGNGSDTTINVTHSLGTLDVIVEVFEVASNETVIADVDRVDTNTVGLTFTVAPTTDQFRVVIVG